MIRKQISRAREHSRNDLLERENPKIFERKPTFNTNYNPAFKNVRAIMEELNMFLTPNKKHRKVFHNVLVIRFQNGKSFS